MGSRDQGGFSLLEILVVLFVVVLVTSLVTLNVGSGSTDIKLEAQMRGLADVFDYGSQEAQLTGVDYGLWLQQVDEGGESIYVYRWLERQQDGWFEPRSGKHVFSSQRLPSSLELQLELEEGVIVELTPTKNNSQPQPQVILYSSGESTAGTLAVSHRARGELLWRLQWDALTRTQLLRGGFETQNVLAPNG